MSWSRENVKMLIEEYQKFPCLYVVKSKEYKNKRARLRALQQICEKLKENRPETTVNDIKIKFTALKTSFMCEHKKYENSVTSGAGEDEIYRSTVWYFHSMSFVLLSNEPRTSFDPVSTVTEGSDQESEDEELIFSNSEDSMSVELSDDTEIPSALLSPVEITETIPCTSTTPVPPSRPKKRKADDDSIISDNAILAEFITSKLNQISNEDIRLDTEHQIINMLYENIRKCKHLK